MLQCKLYRMMTCWQACLKDEEGHPLYAGGFNVSYSLERRLCAGRAYRGPLLFLSLSLSEESGSLSVSLADIQAEH